MWISLRAGGTMHSVSETADQAQGGKQRAAKRRKPKGNFGEPMADSYCPQCSRMAESLQRRVIELEKWKEQAMEDIRALRREHSQLKAAIESEGPCYVSNGMLSTSPGSVCSNDVADSCPQHPSSPISLVELLPPASWMIPHCPQTSSLVCPARSPIMACNVPELPKEGLEPFGKLFGASPARSNPSLAPPPGLAPRPANASALSVPPLPMSRAVTCPPLPAMAEAALQMLSPKSQSPLAPSNLERAASSPDDLFREEAVSLSPCKVEGVDCTRAEWRIEHLSARLKSSMGKPIVSPPFRACGLADLRLMVFPDHHEAKGVRNRKSKDKYVTAVTKGPLLGSLKLKAASLDKHILNCFLTVGTVRRGPFSYDFSEHAMHGCDDFGVDWLEQLDVERSCLRVSLEIFNVRRKEE